MNTFTKSVLSITFIVVIFAASLYFALYLSESSAVQSLVQRFGYLGVLLTGIIVGLNTIVPIHAATFSPIFITAGLPLSMIIFFLAVGTLIADMLAFALGHVSRDFVKEKYPKIYGYATKIHTEKSHLLIPIVTVYAAIVPFPNEAILIPLALAGTNPKKLIIPLIIGNIIHQTLFVSGVTNVLSLVT
jgi:membrane protein YqaA with SNARE-associated domain